MAQDISTLQSPTIEKDGKKKPNLRYWRAQWAAATKARDTWMQDVRKAYDEYMAGRSIVTSTTRADAARYPIYWSAVRVLQPAIYSRTPIPVTEKTFDTMTDNAARLASICSERLAKYLLRACPYDRVMKATRDDYIHAGKTTCRVFFEADLGPENERIDYYEHADIDDQGEPSIIYRNQNGEAFGGEEIQQDDDGYFDERPREQFTPEELASIKCGIIPVSYMDYLHNPNARNEEELTYIRFRNPMTRPECEERWGAAAKDFKYSSLVDEKTKKDVEQSLPTQYAFIGETWDKETKQVYWDCEGCEDDFIEVKDDPYQLRRFFPHTPFMLGTIGPDHMYPVPDYIQLKPFIDQLHASADRLRILLLSARVLGIYDGSYPELDALQNMQGDSIFISVGKIKKIMADGGLDAIFEFFPIEKIMSAIAELEGQIDLFDKRFYQLYGIPDLLRGISDFRETAEAQQKKGNYISLMFADIQREFQRVNRDAIEMMQDLALKKMPMQKLQSIMGFAYMSQEDQAAFPMALQLLQNDEERLVRIDIETDSTITMNQREEIEQKNYLAKTLLDGFAAVATASQQDPMYGMAAMKVISIAVRGVQKGKEIENELDGIMQQMAQQMQQKANTPPPPDPEQVKAQAHAQAIQQKLQADLQLETQKAQAAIAVEDRQTQADIAREDRRAQAKIQSDAAIAEIQGQLKLLEAQISAKSQEHKAGLDAQLAEHKTKLETMSTIFETKMKQAEESRQVKETQERSKQAFTQGPPMNIYVEPNKPKKRKVRVVHNDDGTSDLYSDEMPVE